MKEITLFFLLFLLSCSSKSAENIEGNEQIEAHKEISYSIEGQIINKDYEGKRVLLFETEGKDIFSIDSCVINNGRFNFILNEPETGIFKLGIYRHDLYEFIVNGEEKQISLELNGKSFSKQMRHLASRENDVYAYYKREKQKHNQRLSIIRKEKIDRSAKLKKIKTEEGKLKKIEDQLAEQHTGLFSSKIIKIAQSPFRTNKDHYWSDVDFTDESLIHSSVLNDRIQDYMRNHGKAGMEGNDGFLNAVDFVYSLSSQNERVMNFMLYAMMEGFYSSNMTEVSSYIIDNYVYGDACGTNVVGDLIKQKAKGIRSLEIGQIPPDFTIENENGEVVNFNELTKTKKYTALFFWASWCHKCENEIPMLKRTYDTFAEQGFEIVGISVDKDRIAWQRGIESKECNWINVSQLEEWQSPVVKDYRVNSTPVFFVVNTDRELVFKCKSAVALNNWLSRSLN